MAVETAIDSVAHEVNVARGAPIQRTEVVVLPGDLGGSRQMWALVWARRRVVFRVAAVVTGLVVLYTLLAGIRFESTGQLYLGEISMGPVAPQTPSGGFGLNEAVPGLVASEMEILQSVSLVRRAVLESGANVFIAPVDGGPLSYWEWLRGGQDPESADGILNVVRPTNTALAHNARNAQAFTIKFVTPSDYEVHAKNSEDVLGRGTVGTPFTSPGLTMTLVTGPRGPPVVGTEYDVHVSPLDKTVLRTLSKLKITVPKQTALSGEINVVTLTYTNPSPQIAASFLERLMTAYLDARQSWKTQDAAAAEAFVERQIAGVRESLDQVQTKLAEYRRGNKLVVLDDATKALVEQIGQYEQLRASSRLQATAFSDIKRTLEGDNPPVGAFLMADAGDPVLEKMGESLAAERQKLADYQTRYNETAPDLRQQRALVAEQTQNIRSYVTSRTQRAKENVKALDGIIAQFDDKLKTIPAAELGLAQLTRESEVYSKTYSYLLERQQEAAIFKASTLSKNHVLYAPEPAIRASSPSLLLRALTLPAGLILGVAFILARALFGRSFESAADVRRSVVGVPILATIPRAGTRRRERGAAGAAPHAFDVTALPVTSAFAEAFRSLRARVLRWRAQCRCGIVALITSPQAADGKSMFVRSLASALSASEKRVLVIESDLRKSDAAEREPDLPGLKDVLRGTSDWRTCLERVELAQADFAVLGAGGLDVPELLTSDAMANLVEEVRGAFDFVLIDSHSFPAASDALVLARLADVTLSLVRPRHTDRTMAAEHLSELAAQSTNLAIVINDAAGTSADRSKYLDRKRTTRRGTKRERSQPATKSTDSSTVGWGAPDGRAIVATRQPAREP